MSVSCGEGGPAARTPTPSEDRQAAIDAVIEDFRAEGILRGEALRAEAVFSTWAEAISLVEEWGTTLPEWPSPPPEDATLWVVTMAGEGIYPVPPGVPESGEECLEMLGLVSEDEQLDGFMSAKRSQECP